MLFEAVKLNETTENTLIHSQAKSTKIQCEHTSLM